MLTLEVLPWCDLLLWPRPGDREAEGTAAQAAGEDRAMEKAHHHSALFHQRAFV